MKRATVGMLALLLWGCGPELADEAPAPGAGLSRSQAALGAAPVTPSRNGTVTQHPGGGLRVTVSPPAQPVVVDPLAIPQDPIPCLNSHPDLPSVPPGGVNNP